MDIIVMILLIVILYNLFKPLEIYWWVKPILQLIIVYLVLRKSKSEKEEDQFPRNWEGEIESKETNNNGCK